MSRGFIFLGVAGVGKGTFATRCCEIFGMRHLSMGEALRALAADEGGLARTLKSGGLVDDARCVSVLGAALGAATGPVLLDGFPRTLAQAHMAEALLKDFRVVELKQERAVVREKLLGRRTCAKCGGEFNLAHIVRDGYNMPAMLPDPAACRLGPDCSPDLVARSDDTAETIDRRFEVYDTESAPILDFYRAKGVLREFEVRRGKEDLPALVHAMRAMQ